MLVCGDVLSLICASSYDSLPGFGLASCNKPRRTLVLLRRLTLGAGRLEHVIDLGVFNQTCFCIELPASGGIASWATCGTASESLPVRLFRDYVLVVAVL